MLNFPSFLLFVSCLQLGEIKFAKAFIHIHTLTYVCVAHVCWEIILPNKIIKLNLISLESETDTWRISAEIRELRVTQAKITIPTKAHT
jgi:hypothetical protein